MTKAQSLLLACIACLAYAGCAPTGVHSRGEDKYGCEEPPPDTFTSAGVDAHFAQSTFGKVVTGDVDVKTNPAVVSLASQAIRDARIRDKIRCLAINRDKFTRAQALYLDTMNAFLATNPSAENFMKWQDTHPFPERSDEEIKVLKDVDQLRVQLEKANQELRVLQERSKGRSLTESQRRDLEVALSKGEKNQIEVAFASGNSEAERFAYDLAVALQNSGWKVTHMVSAVYLGGTPIGLLAVVKDPQIPSVQTLLSALLQIDPKIQLKINPKLDVPVKLDVGNKP